MATLKETISKMMGMEVNDISAQQIANNQFGMLSTYIIENRPKFYYYIMVGTEDAVNAFRKINKEELNSWLDEYGSSYDVGKYDKEKLDVSLLGSLEDWGSYAIISEEEYESIR